MIYTFTANPSLDKLFVLESLSIGQYNRGKVTKYDLGGKGINVSRCLKELSDESIILGFFGGSTGNYLIENLRAQGLQVDPIIIEGESRSNITLMENLGERMTKLNEFGPSVNENVMDSLLIRIQELTKKGDIWVLSGSILPGLPENFYAILIEKIQACGGLGFLDTSGTWLNHGYQAVPYTLRINRSEAEALFNCRFKSKEDIFGALKASQMLGVSISVISLDADGAVFADENKILDISAPAVKAKTTVGAGDAMMAMIVHGYINRWPFEKTAMWSVAAGSASILKDGTSVADLETIQTLVKKVFIK